MSINVTVHGNPISIKRGKMVALDSDKDLKLRRKIRIQQVRQQSKKIAEDVRNKVKLEKSKQLGRLGNEAQNELKQNKDKILTSLRQQYKGCISEFGRAYGDADNEADPNEVIKDINKTNRAYAELRGKNAIRRLQDEKEEAGRETRKRFGDIEGARCVEKLRSKLISDLSKSKKPYKKRKKCLANIEINGTVLNISDSDSSSDSDSCDLSVIGEISESKNSESSEDSMGQQSIHSICKNQNYVEENEKCNIITQSRDILPVCGKYDTENLSFQSNGNYKDKLKPTHKTSERLVAIADSIKNIAKEYDAELDFQSGEAPCSKVLHDLENMDPYKPSTSDKLLQRKEKLEFNTQTGSSAILKESYLEDYRKTSNGHISNREKWSEKLLSDSVEKNLISDTDLMYSGLFRPVIISEPCSPNKNKSSKTSGRSRSPEKPCSFRKTLISDKRSTKQNGKDSTCPMQTDFCEKISPTKITPRKVAPRKKSPDKLHRKKSSLHDDNYCLPLVPKTIIVTDPQPNYYDRFTRLSKEGIKPSLVQKINQESIEVVPADDDLELEKNSLLLKQRDNDARKRGNKALEKIKIRQDYQKLLQELPVLQKQERLAGMVTHKPTLHMSTERYQEHQRKKQNAMENKFENFQTKANNFDIPPITLKSIRKSPPNSDLKVPYKTLDITGDNSPILNVGQWEKAETLVSSIDDSVSSETTEQALAELLKRVNKQRELLLKEAVNLKSLGSLKKVLNEDELINIICNCPPRQKVVHEMATSPLLPKQSENELKSSRSKSSKRCAISSSDTSVEVKPQKPPKTKPKTKRLKVYLREEATQTSPGISQKNSVENKEGFTQTSLTSQSQISKYKGRRTKSQKSKERKTSSLSTLQNTCQESTSNNVCEIIIRTEDPKVEIKSSGCKPKNDEQKIAKKSSPKKSNFVIKIKDTKDKRDIPYKNILEMSTSTSYMSPPICKNNGIPCSQSVDQQRQSNKYLLQPQKQQTNIDNLVREQNGSKEVNPRLVKYIMRLLNMSRQSIDDLTISSVSDVSTPHLSIIQTSSNIAKDKLQSVMDHFNLSINDIKMLCVSSSSLSDVTGDISKPEETNSNRKDINTFDHLFGKKLTSLTTSTVTNEDAQVCLNNEKQSASTFISEDRDKRIKDIPCVVPVGHHPSSPIKSPPKSKSKTLDTQHLKSISQGRKQNSSRANSPQRTMPRSPKYESSKIVSVKVASPKRISTKLTVDQNSSPISSQQTNLRLQSPCTQTDQSISQTLSSAKTQQNPEKVQIYGTSDSTSSEDAVLQKEKFLQFVRESLGMSVQEFSELGFHEMFSRHMELTEYCHDRIRSLMSLIQQIRSEKREICSSSSPVDQSMTLTSYLDLPPSKSKQLEPTDKDHEYSDAIKLCLEQDVSSSSTVSQEAIDKYLLGIGKAEELDEKKQDNDTLQSFIPMLQGIPRYSEVDSSQDTSANNYLNIRAKPPPALIRSNMRGHTNDIPHELSTIAEAETVISSRNTTMHRPQTPEEKIPSRDVTPRQIKSPSSGGTKCPGPNPEVTYNSLEQTKNQSNTTTDSSGDYITISPDKTICSSEKNYKRDNRMESLNTSDSSPCNIPNERARSGGISGIQSLSESSIETPDDLESMLRKFKLEWAISLVKKTEQALALSSSSSSSDLGRGKKNESSDVSVIESCRQLCKKLASLNESDIDRAQIVSDLTHHFREFHDISEIPGVADSKNKSQQRTSTPVQQSKSAESKKSITNESLFKVDSELSSVKNSSDDTNDHLFLSIPNVTLKTDHYSLMRS